MVTKEGIQAVIFDLDGLMIDSERLALEVWRDFLAEYGKELTLADYRKLIGTESLSSAQFVRQRTGIGLEAEAIVEEHWRRLTIMITKKGEPMAGLHALIRALQARGLSLAVASNSRRDYVERALVTCRIENSFRCVVSADQVARGKPAPDVYLAAATCLNIPPDRCLALEDTPIGLRSALDAGMRCVVVPNQDLDGEDFTGAYSVFNSLVALREALDMVLQ